MTAVSMIARGLTGGRYRARQQVDILPLPLQGLDIVLDCGAVQASTQGYADEQVRVTLVERGAARLILANADHEGAIQLVAWMVEAAEIYHVRDQLVIPTAALYPALALVS